MSRHMISLDECGLPLLVEGVQKMRRESVLSIAQAARRVGSVVVVLGEQNTQMLCEIDLQKPMGLSWFVDGVEVTAAEVSHLLDRVQGMP